MKRQQGFTLIELMIVVAIIGVIAAFATTSYQSSVTKTKRADAKATLMDLAAQFERCYTANGQYTTTAAAGLQPAKTCILVDVSDALNTAPINYTLSAKGYYNISLMTGADVITTTTFKLKATPRSVTANESNSFVDDKCTDLFLDNLGRKTAAGTDSANCW